MQLNIQNLSVVSCGQLQVQVLVGAHSVKAQSHIGLLHG